MIASAAYVYLRCLFALELLVFAVALFLDLCALAGATGFLREFGVALLYAALLGLIPVCGLAEDRNVWRNELRVYPRWVRIVISIATIYGLMVGASQVRSLMGGSGSSSAVYFGVESIETMPLCIVYSLLSAGPVRGPELVKRVQRSLVVSAIAVSLVMAARLGYLISLKRQ
jgi:hypothetical protein